jgi:hypothetical protein
MTLITAAFFFHRLAPSAYSPYPAHFHLLGQQLPSSFGHCVRVQMEKLSNLAVCA